MINDLYRKIAQDPKNKTDRALTKTTKQLLNRARVRVQALQKMQQSQELSYSTLNALQQLKQSGLTTQSGNVSLKLPKTREKILNILHIVTNFLSGDTTVKQAKASKQKEEKQKQYSASIPERKKKKYPIGVYWQIARESGILNIVDYDAIRDNLVEISDKYTPMDFAAYAYNWLSGDSYNSDEATDDFFNYIGLDI